VNDLLKAELAQARNAYAKAMQERETYVRLLACVVDGKGEITPNGVAVRKTDFTDVPKKYRVEVKPGRIAPSDGPQDEEHYEDALLVSVTAPPTNGHVLAGPAAPRIVMPS